MPSRGRAFGTLVIGGGLMGLCALYHLGRLGAPRLGLIERFRLGHDRGSSHGKARITRNAYAEASYIRLMHQVHSEEWPRLERDANLRLIHPCPGCLFGPPGTRLRKYTDAVREAGVPVEILTADEGRRRFPQFRFENTEHVLHDHTAGIVAAEEALTALEKIARKNHVEIFEDTIVEEIHPGREPIEMKTSRGVFQAERLIVTAGAWTPGLLPFLAPKLRVARQTVAYFRPRGPRDDYRPGRFPVWVYLEDGENNVFYGLPEFGQPGIKAARHLSETGEDNPDEAPDEIDSRRVSEIEDFLLKNFSSPSYSLISAEHCLYTNTATEDFIIDLHPHNPRIAFGAGFSGHGFKFGPLAGRLIAELALDGKIKGPGSEEVRSLFGLGPKGPN